jgi:hypothetical protein
MIHDKCPQCAELPGNKFFYRGQYCLCGWRKNGENALDSITALQLRHKLSALREHFREMSAKVVHIWFTQSGDDPVNEWFEKAREILGEE